MRTRLHSVMIVATLTSALAPGSYLVISHLTGDLAPGHLKIAVIL